MAAVLHATAEGLFGALRRLGAGRWVSDSREVQPGDVFVAWPGAAHDARQHVPAALAAGAVAALVEAQGLEAFECHRDARVQAWTGLKAELGPLASGWHGHPSHGVAVVAVTGTNGKTSSVWWLAQLSGLLKRPAAFVGTLGVGRPPVGGAAAHWLPTGLTTPDPVRWQGALAHMRQDGLHLCAVEASSIGLVEHRLAGTEVAVAVFTNFTQDHLDFHGSMDAYWQAKRALFDWPGLKAAVVNVDDPQGARLAAELSALTSGPALWTVSAQANGQARLQALDLEGHAQGWRFTVVERSGQGEVLAQAAVNLPLLGHYNVLNALGVMAALRAQGHELAALAAAMAALTPVPGRLHTLGGEDEPLGVVDYAHTPDALVQVLQALRPVARQRGGRLWCVVGCGGDRDRSKRPLMAAAAQQGADALWLTSDNPRSEAPESILDDMAQGLDPLGSPTQRGADRAEVVRRALCEAAAADVVLVAGKGHETTQEVAGVKHAQCDADLVRQGLRQWHARGQAQRAPGWTWRECMLGLKPVNGQPGQGPQVLRFHTDSRSLQPGDLFVALKGDRFDGHDFVPQLAQGPAVGAVVHRPVPSGGRPTVLVNDSLEALQRMARWWRDRLDLPVVAVTGSNGKTTVTQMVASVLRAWHGPLAHATRGNLNNHIGLPLSVLGLRADAQHGHRSAVLELGMNHPGEIALLASIAQPTVALVNNAQREHQEFMHSVEAVAEENAEVFKALPLDGVAVFPAHDGYTALWQRRAAPRRVIRFALEGEGPASAAEVTVGGQWHADHWQATVHLGDEVLPFTLHMAGRHNLRNAAAAAASAWAAGAPASAIAEGLTVFRPVAGRSALQRTAWKGREVSLVDDSYNANPDSVRAAVEVLASLPGPHWLLLGDMGEVGQQGPAFHAEVGRFAREQGIDCLWTVGDLCAHAASAHGSARHFESVEALCAALSEGPTAASIVVKGSRFMRMERVVQALSPRAEVH